MNKFFGQALNETSILIIAVILVGLGAAIASSGKIADFFDNSNKMAMDKSEIRTEFKKDINKLPELSDITIKVDDKEVQVPVEEIIRKKLREGKYIQTLGDSGNLDETIALLNEYTKQIEEIIEDSPQNYDFVKQALISYTDAIDEYVSKDAKIVQSGNDPLLKLLNELDIAIDLSQEGDQAMLIDEAIKMIQMKYGHTKTGQLLIVYMNDMLKLGKSINYEVDSRLANKLEGYSDQEALTEEINEKDNNNDVVVNKNMSFSRSSSRNSNTGSNNSSLNLSKNGFNFNNNNNGKNSTTNITTDGKNFDLDYINSETFASPSMVDKWNQEFNDLQARLEEVKADNHGENIVEVCRNKDAECIMDEIAGTMMFEEECDINDKDKDCHGSHIVNLNGNVYAFDNSAPGIITNEGVSMIFLTNNDYYDAGTDSVCQVLVDVDGHDNGPNVIGMDKFMAIIKEDGTIQPWGWGTFYEDNCNSASTGLACSSTYIREEQGPPRNDLEALKNQLENLLMDDNLAYSEKADIAKEVNIYREGSYSDILGNSMNTEKLNTILDKNNESNDNILNKMKSLDEKPIKDQAIIIDEKPIEVIKGKPDTDLPVIEHPVVDISEKMPPVSKPPGKKNKKNYDDDDDDDDDD